MSKVVIPHDAIKRRVVKSDACSADVAPRVLYRIDVDDDFRDALHAVLDLRDEIALATNRTSTGDTQHWHTGVVMSSARSER